MEEKKYLQKYKAISCAVIVLAAIIVVIMAFNTAWDSDSLWIIASGRDIIQNGIPHINNFTVISDSGVIVQQWLFDVVFALFDKLGIVGHYLFSLMTTAILFFSTYLYFSRYKIAPVWKTIGFLMCFCTVFLTLSSSRPNVITVALLMLTCFSLEKYNETDEKKWLILLPVLTLLEANLHAALILVHFAVIFAYVVPSVIKKWYQNNGLQTKIKPIIIFTVIAFFTSMINPYGIKNTLYLPVSVIGGYSRFASIMEMQPMTSTSIMFVTVCAVLFLWVYLNRKKELKNHQVYLAAGFLALAIVQVRNVMYLFIALASELPIALKDLQNIKIRIKKKLSRMLLTIALVCAIVISCAYLINVINNDVTKKAANPDSGIEVLCPKYDELEEAAEYLRDNEKNLSDITMYTGYNTGAYFEYIGVGKIYIDARAEVYMKNISHTYSALAFYRSLCNGTFIAPTEINYFFQYYDFDYLVIEKSNEHTLCDYMNNYDKDYVLVVDTEKYSLYKNNRCKDT